jgi:[2-(trimethylamino)ethyl]phosphonate dioxygenase
MIPPITQLTLGTQFLTLHWADGVQQECYYLWLRDNAPEARDPRNGQRLIEAIDLPTDIHAQAATLNPAGQVEITWSHEQGHSCFAPAWLRGYAALPAPRSLRLWDATLPKPYPTASYPEIREKPTALHYWLAAVADYGFALLQHVPTTSQALLQVVDLFGYVRETNYGKYFDVKSVVNPNNLAYTGLALSPHTDNPYRDPTPTLQLLHCLQNAAEGGENTLVDGFLLAETLRNRAPEHFHLLTTQPVRFRFQDKESDLVAETPLIRLDTQGQVMAVRYNNRSQAPFHFVPALIPAYYAAYRAFGQMVNNPAYQLRFKLNPGDLFIVDNERILHGRTGFSSGGTRHLQGCYADRDGLYSKLRVTNHK